MYKSELVNLRSCISIAGWPVSHDLVILFRLMLAGDAIALGSNQVEVEVEVHFH
jgi:hypothetical protein